jgi:FkbM family methyltransferase
MAGNGATGASMLSGLGARGLHWASESFTRLVYAKVVQPGDTVLDIGANEGFHTAELARLVGASGVVHAFEPNVAHFKRLLSISENVRLWPMAIGDRLTVETLHVPDGLDGWASLSSLETLLPDRKIARLTVLQVPLDALGVPVGPRLPFIKLDVENHELHALRGGLRFIEAHRPLIALENVHAEIAEVMRSLRYTVTDFFGTPLARFGDPASLANSLLVPDEALSTTTFLVPGSPEVTGALSEARLLDTAPQRPEGAAGSSGLSPMRRVLRRLGLGRRARD